MSPPQQLRQQTSNCSSLLIYRSQKDERLSWTSWLTYSGWLTHISGHPSAASRAQDSERTPAKDGMCYFEKCLSLDTAVKIIGHKSSSRLPFMSCPLPSLPFSVFRRPTSSSQSFFTMGYIAFCRFCSKCGSLLAVSSFVNLSVTSLYCRVC